MTVERERDVVGTAVLSASALDGSLPRRPPLLDGAAGTLVLSAFARALSSTMLRRGLGIDCHARRTISYRAEEDATEHGRLRLTQRRSSRPYRSVAVGG